MRTRGKPAALVAVLALAVGLMVWPAYSGSGVANCIVIGDTTSTYGTPPEQRPRPLLLPQPIDPQWGSTSTLTWVCAGAISGQVTQPGVTNTITGHCNTALVGGINPGHASPTLDDAAWTAMCVNPVVTLRPMHIFGTANTVDFGSFSCQWDTNGHFLLTVSALDLNNFTCTNNFGGPGTVGRSTIAVVLDLNPLYSLPPYNCMPPPCWLHAYSVSDRIFIKAP